MVQGLFEANTVALKAEQERYVASGIRHADRPRDLLAAGLIPEDMWPVDEAVAAESAEAEDAAEFTTADDGEEAELIERGDAAVSDES